MPSVKFSVEYPKLNAIEGLTAAADRIVYFTGPGAVALATLTAAGRALIDDANAAAQRATLGLEIGVDVQARSAKLDAISGATPIADGPHTVGGITITTVGGIITAIA
ncbi:hypothetical protein [Sphingomonas sanxanigenens]|uniref:Uncharacterized protein n=1 Tax=Sphingomonas sanxanigenens DSM 19645 = NX02 TaxID=1123269 RepID=W0AHQ8_9SPHN|nr:hypothetical protein [Sphingomonas sanxanigenens]AHE57439.1 hypothetical protein NX02_29375 [Sphingomonas sanxanigenens DSM 19645 = NX02]